jgi:hypothetical protein
VEDGEPIQGLGVVRGIRMIVERLLTGNVANLPGGHDLLHLPIEGTELLK